MEKVVVQVRQAMIPRKQYANRRSNPERLLRERGVTSAGAALLAAALIAAVLLPGYREEKREVSAAAEAPKTDVSAPAQPPEKPILVGEANWGVRLIGTWTKEKGWRNASFGDLMELLPQGGDLKDLLPQGGEWTLYHLGHAPLTTTSGPPKLHLDERGQPWFYYTKLTKRPPHPADRWLAVSGAPSVDRGAVEMLPNQEDLRTHWVRFDAQGQGYWHRDLKILQNISVDLDGDGKPEQLVTVEEGLTYGADLIVCHSPQSSDDWPPLGILTEEAWQDLRSSGRLRAQIGAIADINGDGRREIGIKLDSYDMCGYEIHTFDGKEFRRVLHLYMGYY